jgi:hypothetical protein
MSIVTRGTQTYEDRGETIDKREFVAVVPAVVESIVADQYVSLTNTDTIAGDGLATCTRALKVLTADKMAGTGNASRALEVITAATPGSFADVEVGDVIEINGSAAGTVTQKISSTIINVDASGTIGASTWTFQRPMFKDVYPGATLVHATGPATLVVESKTSNFVVVTTTSGTITTGLLTSATNINSVLSYKEDDSKGEIYGVALDAFTKTGTTYDSTQSTPIRVKWLGFYDKSKTTTVDHATAGTVPESIHRKAVRLMHATHQRNY